MAVMSDALNKQQKELGKNLMAAVTENVYEERGSSPPLLGQCLHELHQNLGDGPSLFCGHPARRVAKSEKHLNMKRGNWNIKEF